MSAALDLINRASRAGVTLRPRLWAEGADRLDDACLAGLRANETDIIRALLEQSDRASSLALEATERAAIIAESEHGNATAPVPHILPASWADATIMPTAGARCHCCKEARWCCETVSPSGWRCVICHPPGHLTDGQFHEVTT